MSLYLMTPYGRYLARRRMWDRLAEDQWSEESNRVYFPVDLKSDDQGYTLTALIPGVKSEDLNVQVLKDTITIQGEIRNERDEDANYILSERPSGKFNKVIHLPDEVDSAKAEASLKDGIFTLFIPKVEEARPKQIKVTVK
jgi:HSP20 family protein